jgi:hypothetical protein
MSVSSFASRPRARRAIWAAASLAIGASTVAFTPAIRTVLVPGLTYQFNMSTSESDESFAAAGKTLAKSVGTVRIAGDKARIDFAEVKGPSTPMMSKDGYMLVHDGGNTMFMVDTKEKQYMKIDAKALGSMFSSLSSMSGGLMKIEVKDASMSVKKIGAGESIVGYATEQWQIAQAYTMTVKTFGFGSTSRTESNTTLWMAPQLKSSELMNPMIDMGRNMAAMFEGNAEWEKALTGPSKELPQVAVLKMRSTSKTTADKGKPQFSISDMEVTKWSKGDVAAADLELPKDFKAIEMPNMAAISDSMKAAGMDTVDLKAAMKQAGFKDEDIAAALKQAALDGAKDQAKQEARDAGANAVKAGVRGLLRRKPPAI